MGGLQCSTVEHTLTDGHDDYDDDDNCMTLCSIINWTLPRGGVPYISSMDISTKIDTGCLPETTYCRGSYNNDDNTDDRTLKFSAIFI